MLIVVMQRVVPKITLMNGDIFSNTDLMAVFKSNTTEAIKHYISFEKAEGRSTNIFNAQSYLNNYADLRSAFETTKHLLQNIMLTVLVKEEYFK